jgi:hypothetical protein
VFGRPCSSNSQCLSNFCDSGIFGSHTCE